MGKQYKWDDKKYKAAASKRQKRWTEDHPEHIEKLKLLHHGPLELVTEQVDITKPKCPYCSSVDTVKHGHTNDKQRYQCKDCKKHFT